MKRYLVPGIVIGLLLSLIGGTLGHFLTDTQSAKTSPKKNLLAPMQDRTTIDFKNISITTGPKVPAWGMIRQATQPTIESTSFHNAKVATATQGNQKKLETKKKKKKAAKKKKTKKPIQAKKRPSPQEPSEPQTSGSNYDYLVASDLSGGKKKPTKPQTSEDWFQVITDPENREQLEEFIKLHQAGLVTDVVFFEVSEKLLNSSSSSIKKFGLLALGSFLSAKSFELTAEYVGQESNGNLRAMALGNLDVYQNANSLGLLRTLLSNPKDSTRYFSSYLIGGSAQLNLRPVQPAAVPANPPVRGGRDGSSTIRIQTYQSLIPMLETVMTSDPNGDVRQAALRSRDIIRGLIPPPFVAGF